MLILYINGGTYSLQSTDFLRNFSWQFLFTLRVFARNLLRGNRQRNIFRILFWCLAWGSNPGFSSNKSRHYLLDHGDFILLDYPSLNAILNCSLFYCTLDFASTLNCVFLLYSKYTTALICLWSNGHLLCVVRAYFTTVTKFSVLSYISGSIHSCFCHKLLQWKSLFKLLC